jgi:hypothetical protein
MAWADDVADGLREGLADAGLLIKWRGKMLPALQGSGISLEMLANGGIVDGENPSFTVLKSDMPAGRGFKQGDKIELAGKTFVVKSISFDVADPDIRIATQGEGQ